MKVYFVRHGQTIHHSVSRTQNAKSKLSETGIKQASAVAKRLSKLDFDLIISSNLTRAKETAAVISKTSGKKVIYTNLLNEWKHPSEIDNEIHGSELVAKIDKIRNKHADDKNWHYSDEENKFDFTSRIKKLLAYLSKRKEKAIVVVTHGGTLRGLLLENLGGSKLDFKTMWKMWRFFAHENTGITEIEITDGRNWKLITWNDRAHLH